MNHGCVSREREVTFKHLSLILVELDDKDCNDIFRCPHCGHQDDLDGYDVIGADTDCVFCNNCNMECSIP
jgi:transcription elongation factor Elf1